jgi:hypothetical protein
MRRREFIAFLGGAAAWPPLAHSQESKMPRIGALYIGTADAESFKKELREGLRELSYVEGQNLAFEFRSAEGKLDRLPELAAELVQPRHTRATHSMTICSELRAGISRLKGLMRSTPKSRTRVESV